MPGGTNGEVVYTLGAEESWVLDSAVFDLGIPLGAGQVVPTLIARTADGKLIAQVSAPAISV